MAMLRRVNSTLSEFMQFGVAVPESISQSQADFFKHDEHHALIVTDGVRQCLAINAQNLTVLDCDGIG